MNTLFDWIVRLAEASAMISAGIPSGHGLFQIPVPECLKQSSKLNSRV